MLRNQPLLLLGYAVALLLLNAHFIATVELKQLWYFQVTYVRQYVVHSPLSTSMGLPEPFAWLPSQTLPVPLCLDPAPDYLYRGTLAMLACDLQRETKPKLIVI